MNLASWVILAVLVAVIGLAVKATFFGKRAKGCCCDTGDSPARGAKSCCEHSTASTQMPRARANAAESNRALAPPIASCTKSECGGCTLCNPDSAVARNAVEPIVKPVT